MSSSSRSIASAFALALALSLAVADKPLAAQATAQDTAHKGMKMPPNMPMGKKSQKKKTATKPATPKKSAMPMGADTSHHEMGGMNMQPAPSKRDSTKMPDMPGMEMPSKPTDSAHTAMPGMKHHSADDMMIGPVGVSMERMGSGTTWVPDAVTLPSRRRMLGDWMLMAHGFVFAQYDKQSGERGDNQFGSLNWGMLMATHDFAGGRFQARTMLSLDPLTVTNRGYPLLLQTGETYNGEPLHDRQHPHDFWMELGALYQRPITKS